QAPKGLLLDLTRDVFRWFAESTVAISPVAPDQLLVVPVFEVQDGLCDEPVLVIDLFPVPRPLRKHLLRHNYLRFVLSRPRSPLIAVALVRTSHIVHPRLGLSLDRSIWIVPPAWLPVWMSEGRIRRVHLSDLFEGLVGRHWGKFALALSHSLADAGVFPRDPLPFAVSVDPLLATLLVLTSNSQFDLT